MLGRVGLGVRTAAPRAPRPVALAAPPGITGPAAQIPFEPPMVPVQVPMFQPAIGPARVQRQQRVQTEFAIGAPAGDGSITVAASSRVLGGPTDLVFASALTPEREQREFRTTVKGVTA